MEKNHCHFIYVQIYGSGKLGDLGQWVFCVTQCFRVYKGDQAKLRGHGHKVHESKETKRKNNFCKLFVFKYESASTLKNLPVIYHNFHVEYD